MPDKHKVAMPKRRRSADPPATAAGHRRVRVLAVAGATAARRMDAVAVEEPLEIRVATAALTVPVAVTMRTPGHDFDLAVGFLFGEGVIAAPGDVAHIGYCLDPDLTSEQRWNVVTVSLRDGLEFDVRRLERHFTTTSACGVCGKASLDQLELRGLKAQDGPRVSTALLMGLPERLRGAQGLFDRTGGLHAAALFEASGELVAVREDVGRHNALDKLIGWAVREGRTPLGGHIVLLSGRASYELLQKSLAAGIGIVCAVSAPSSLAVDVARRFDMTLVGFLRGERLNVYSGAGRVAEPAS